MNKEQKIESILTSLEGMEGSSPKPFFFTRVMARLQRRRDAVENIIGFISRPVVAVAALALIILLNGYVMLTHLPQNDAASSNEIASVDEYIELNMNFFDSDKPNR